jgi:glycosyltransferase involved in cell wall biosynthesis
LPNIDRFLIQTKLTIKSILKLSLESMISSQPKVSVVMPVYNGELYLREAIDSILNQTFSDFELIVMDDGSSDGSVAIVRAYTDPRIRFVANPVNQGIRFIANQLNQLARSEYIARMDCDDISLPQRLAKQVDYLDRHPDVAVVGAQSIYIDINGKVADTQNIFRCAIEPSSMKWTASYECPFVNPSVMFRKQVLCTELGGYDENATFAEDYEIWLRLLRNNYQGANLAEVLIEYRINPKSMMHSASNITVTNAVSPLRKFYLDTLIPGYDREKEMMISFFATRNPHLALAANQAMDTLRERYISIYLNGKVTRDLAINIARERAYLGYCSFAVDRWGATRLIIRAIWQYPRIVRELPLLKIVYLMLFGSSGRNIFRSFQPKSN